MKERPIRFSAPMVRAILEGRKTQTRRVVKPQPVIDRTWLGGWKHETRKATTALGSPLIANACPYGQPGDRLWVRETWAPRTLGAWPLMDQHMKPIYRASEDRPEWKQIWKPSIHMPRWASRITLEVTGVRVERLQDISEADAIAEGVERTITGDGWRRYCNDPELEACGLTPCASAANSFRSLWEWINSPDSWTANPWVWVVEFRRLQP